MDEEIILPENKMYIVMTPIGEDQINIICIDKMQKPINELYYMMRGLCEMSIKQQEDLVNTRFIRDVFTYDNETAEKEFYIDLYDPFKGILPGFIDKEIDLKTLRDPIVYDGRKTRYGRKQVGLRWWDTTNVRYEWYEQGSGNYGANGFNNYERTINWGNMFPGSQINIYE